MFENLKKDPNVQDTSDELPTMNRELGSDVYDATVDVAYVTKSSKNTTGIVCHFKLDNGRDYKQILWVQSASGEYIWKKEDGRSGYWPGYVLFDDIAQIATGKDASFLPDPEDKILRIYDPLERKEKPTEVPVVTALQGAKVKLGILHQKQDHYKNEATWQSTNELVKVFHPTGHTVMEKAADTEPKVMNRWLERYQFEVVDKRKKSKEGIEYDPKAVTQAADAGTDSPQNSLFDE